VVGAAPAEHYEILLRFTSPEGQLILPGTFIPAAERYNLMSAIDRWVIRATFEYCARTRAQLPKSRAMRLSVNLSGDSLNDDSLLDFIRQQFKTFDLTPSTICFEITKTAAIARLNQAVDLMKALKAIGCRFALDDFGRGCRRCGISSSCLWTMSSSTAASFRTSFMTRSITPSSKPRSGSGAPWASRRWPSGSKTWRLPTSCERLA
jgi:predicted signal transduction protein with EAL and GGDEF domain